MKGYLVLCLLRCLEWLPLSISRCLGKLVGAIGYRLNGRSCQVARTNLKLCFPSVAETIREKLCQERMKHMAQTIFETPRLWRCSPLWLKKRTTEVYGLDNFKQAIKNDRGTIFVVPHMGNWEVIGLWLAHQTKITSLYEPPKLVALEKWIRTCRQSSGATLVPTSPKGIAELLKALKKGEAAGILPDQQPPIGSGKFSTFFGCPAFTMTLIHRLIQRGKVNILFCAALRVSGGWKLYFNRPDEDIFSSKQENSLKALNLGVEKIVLLDPSQYLWEYERFRHGPKGSPSAYE